MLARYPLSLAAWAASVVLIACGPSGGAAAVADGPTAVTSAAPAGNHAAACPAYREVTPPLAGLDSKYVTLSYWLEQLASQYPLDDVLLTPAQIETANDSLREPRSSDYHPPRDLLEPFDVLSLEREVSERRGWARDKLTSGEYVTRAGARLDDAALAMATAEVPLGGATPALRVALADAQIHCAPIPDGFYGQTLDLRLDRNACSMLRAQEAARVVAEWPNRMRLVQTATSFGWLMPDVPLSPPLPRELERAFVHDRSLRVTGGELRVAGGATETVVPDGALVPSADKRGRRAHVATAAGFEMTALADAERLATTRRELTRRALLTEVFRFIGSPYGLGDTAGGRDCSRLLLDAFATFGLALPRHSTWQSQAGSFWIDVRELPATERPLLFDVAAQKGLVLLSFPGHIMLYLGRNEHGEPMVLHGLGEYVETCPGGGETVVRVKDITVTTLDLGRGTSRTALLERVTRVTVIGGAPGGELAGVAQLRPSAPARIPGGSECRDSEQAAIYAMPEQPNREQPLSVVSVTSKDPGSARLTLIDPAGQRIVPDALRLGGPPHGRLATVREPRPGRWKAVLADGNDVLACQVITVKARRPAPAEPDTGPIWKPEHRWHRGNENLYALFVERLFDYPIAEDRTWSNLHSLLRDPEHNVLFDYRGQDEDAELELRPDCADLPYALRAYFAWKLRLPFGYRRCTRGRLGRPPTCDVPGARDNLMSRLELPGKGGLMQPRGDLEAFELFMNTQLSSGVHSSSGRTSPKDDRTDLYPVPLSRAALAPGTVFADPYGHLLVLAKWIPQTLTGPGTLIGVDAQPDGTVGQRRFWRGSFLFDPDTASGGAGFKAFRPRTFVEGAESVELEVDGARVAVERVGRLEEVPNVELERSRTYERHSLEQYQGSSDDFYGKLESLINPRPLAPNVALGALVQALYEQVTRRVLSIDNGERWFKEHPGALIDMPDGASIFLSAGPWEDFSTPSRDLRLLIAIDTVRGFPAVVRAAPARYGIAPERLDAAGAELERALSEQLATRTFTYTRSDGSAQQLSLRDVLERSAAFETGYNPNDCAELRWGAPEGSSELTTCTRRAPPDQRAKLETHRHWFASRKRPPQ